MSKSKNRRKKGPPLSLEETVKLFGAKSPVPLGHISPDPLTVHVLATQVGRRLVSQGGRPTDKSWDVTRKVPMKSATWDECKRRAEALGEEGRRVAAGQVAAMALEIGLRRLDLQPPRRGSAALALPSGIDYEPEPDSKEEAEELCAAVEAGGVW